MPSPERRSQLPSSSEREISSKFNKMEGASPVAAPQELLEAQQKLALAANHLDSYDIDMTRRRYGPDIFQQHLLNTPLQHSRYYDPSNCSQQHVIGAPLQQSMQRGPTDYFQQQSQAQAGQGQQQHSFVQGHGHMTPQPQQNPLDSARECHPTFYHDNTSAANQSAFYAAYNASTQREVSPSPYIQLPQVLRHSSQISSRHSSQHASQQPNPEPPFDLLNGIKNRQQAIAKLDYLHEERRDITVEQIKYYTCYQNMKDRIAMLKEKHVLDDTSEGNSLELRKLHEDLRKTDRIPCDISKSWDRVNDAIEELTTEISVGQWRYEMAGVELNGEG